MKNNKLYFSILTTAMLIVVLGMKYLLKMDELTFNTLSEQMTANQVENTLAFNKKWEWLGYVLLPIILLIKIYLISAILYMGIFFFDKKIAFTNLLNMVIKAEFIFVLVAIVKLVWFVFQDNYTLSDVQNFYPLSALNIVGNEDLSPWFLYPFQTLNLFELVYWLILAWFIGKGLKSSIDKALKIVASSYGSALLIWVVAIMFFTLNFS